MSIWKMCQDYLQERRQKGQIIVFTAVLLPFIIAMCGFTIDFGNMYIHKSRLQNAADAAAIAGAYAYADNNEVPKSHPEADLAADKSVQINHANFSNLTRAYKARESGTKKYFKAGLTENVPVYFLRYFGVGDTAEVDAEAVAAIETSSSGGTTGGGGSSIFSNLFSFGSGGFNSTNNGQNPDNPNNSINYDNVATYDGAIVNVGPDAGSTTFTHKLLTSQAREAVRNGEIKSTTDAINKGYYTDVTTDKTKSLDEQLADIKAKAQSSDTGINLEWQNGVNLSAYLGVANGKDYIYNSSSNFELKIDKDYFTNNANSNKPLYIVVDNPGMCKITLTAKYNKAYEASRPIVFVYTGTGEIQMNTTVNNSFFRGIIYAPYGTVSINDNKLTYKGSIAANRISMGSVGYYTWESIITDGSGSGSSPTPSTSTSSIGLVSPPSDIDWND